MTNRVINFNAGPSTLPLAALQRARDEFLDIESSGMSILEHSHRGALYEKIHNEAIALLREVANIPDTHEVLFMQGGASGQFAYVPMNLLPPGKSADYIMTGAWSEKALEEAKIVGQARVAATTESNKKYTRVPKQSELNLDKDAAYVHYTTNNTIFGTQFFYTPETGDVPLIADMSSDIFWRPTDFSKYGIAYAGAQKNIGPAGIAVVIIRKDLVEKGEKSIPKIFRYSELAKNNSLQNTIPTFGVYLIRNVMQVVKDEGGLAAVEKRNLEKARILYAAMDGDADFYRCPVEKDSRSVMNPVFNLPSEDLEKKFVKEAEKAGMVGLKGHRSVGGIRASMYNAMTVEGVAKLVEFMSSFKKTA